MYNLTFRSTLLPAFPHLQQTAEALHTQFDESPQEYTDNTPLQENIDCCAHESDAESPAHEMALRSRKMHTNAIYIPTVYKSHAKRQKILS
jgi:hypothetical protein